MWKYFSSKKAHISKKRMLFHFVFMLLILINYLYINEMKTLLTAMKFIYVNYQPKIMQSF